MLRGFLFLRAWQCRCRRDEPCGQALLMVLGDRLSYSRTSGCGFVLRRILGLLSLLRSAWFGSVNVQKLGGLRLHCDRDIFLL